MKNNLNPARCASCGCTGVSDRLHPFCSVVCRTLGQVGLAWRTGPCRIVDLQSGALLSTGPEFDLTTGGLIELRKKAERLRQGTPEAVVREYPALPLQPRTSSEASFLASVSL
jgi:hypothetical protein